MAFNPFHSFRKHKKIIFASLTILCMFTFVLAGNFRGADAFDWLISKFGGGNSKQGEVVTTLYGDKVHEGQLSERSRLRQIANDFSRRAVAIGVESMRQKLETLAKKGEEADPKATESAELRSMAQQMSSLILILTDPRFEQFRGNPQMIMTQLTNMQSSLQTLRRSLERKNLDDDVQTVDGMLLFTTFQIWAMTTPDARNAFLFGGSPKKQDTLDFMVWLKQADTLGITLTENDIRTTINRLTPLQPTLTGNKTADQKVLVDLFGKEADYIDLKTLYRALGDEIRVSLARGIILGEESGFFSRLQTAFREPLGITPGEYVDYYREQLQKTNVALLPIPVSAFVTSKDIPEPTARQIEELYELYRDYDPRPFSSTPGFKIPQRVRVQWVNDAKIKKATFEAAAKLVPLSGWLTTVVDPRELHYEQRAHKHLATLVATSVGQATTPGSQPLGLIYGIDRIHDAAREVRAFFPQPSLLQGDPTAAFHTAAGLRSDLMARFVALTLSGAATNGSPFIPTVGATFWLQAASSDVAFKNVADSLKRELTNRSVAVAGLVGGSLRSGLAGTGPWLWADSQHEVFPDSKGVFPFGTAVFEANVPLDILKEKYFEQLLHDVARRQESDDVNDFTTKLAEAKSDVDKAKKVIADFTTKMRLQNTSGESVTDNDMWTVSKDPGLAPLNSAFKAYAEEQFRVSNPDLRVAVFDGSPLYNPASIRGNATRPNYFFWKTKNEGARASKLDEVINSDTQETVRDQVIKAWRALEARKVARKKAEAIAKEIEGKGEKEAIKVLNDLLKNNPTWGNLIRFDDLARQKKMERLNPRDRFTYDAFKIPEDEIAYPGPTFLDDILKLEENQTTVLKDRPEQYYYVAYVTKRPAEPSVKDALDNDNRANMWAVLENKEKRKRQETLMEELRRQAAGKQGLDARGRFVLNPKIKKDDVEVAE